MLRTFVFLKLLEKEPHLIDKVNEDSLADLANLFPNPTGMKPPGLTLMDRNIAADVFGLVSGSWIPLLQRAEDFIHEKKQKPRATESGRFKIPQTFDFSMAFGLTDAKAEAQMEELFVKADIKRSLLEIVDEFLRIRRVHFGQVNPAKAKEGIKGSKFRIPMVTINAMEQMLDGFAINQIWSTWQKGGFGTDVFCPDFARARKYRAEIVNGNLVIHRKETTSTFNKPAEPTTAKPPKNSSRYMPLCAYILYKFYQRAKPLAPASPPETDEVEK
jgi:hypothetical protein